MFNNNVLKFSLIFIISSFWSVESKRIPKWHLKLAQSQGPNTCAVEEVPGTNKKYWTECKYWMNREICGVKTVLRYECCEGFHQIARNEGCNGVKPMTDVVRTARDIGATVFVDYLNEAGLTDQLKSPGEAITLFAPTNVAFERLSPADQETLRVSLLERESPFLLYHVVSGRKLHSKDFKGEQEIETLNRGHKLRINKYNHGMTTVNCAPMVRKDQQATNGIVHLIDEVLIPPFGAGGRPSIPETLFSDGRFREMSRFMLTSNYVNDLRQGGPFTLLAPTDEAFQSISASELDRITSDPEARLALMKNHIIPHTVCIPAVIDTHKMKNIAGQKLQLSCNQSGVYVEDAKVSKDQMMAKNGAISVISKVLIPDRSRSVMSLLARRPEQVSTFTRLLRKSGVEAYLNKPNISVTVFAPSNYAFNQMPEEEFSLLDEDQRKLEELMKHHVVIGRVKTESISDNQNVDSIDGRNALRLKVYRKEVGVESAILEDSDIEGQNGVLHIINRVLTPPNHSVMELLQSKVEYSTMADAIHHVQEYEPHFLNTRGNKSFTIFVPTNDAFMQLGEDNLHSLMKNRRKLKKMVQNHVVDNMFSAGSIHRNLQYNVRTEYQTVNIHKEKDGLMVNKAHVIEPDVVTKEGIVHCIDQVLIPERRRKS
ncbi:transforming growth factor-beta-induced protein ig-h3-like [Parasteatoda tepidariorum]|uniref:transforming growth factor-beta-induced protein ig-h3-like n=1 Tax=Parasteatoda tepidariorum TaxID=114398 RepID=UPI001C71A27C|nr:transforming growth factor-beta-induced protein ig-h3-like [Parasteatoda tepidariorum]